MVLDIRRVTVDGALLATKLIRRFISDEPPPALVDGRAASSSIRWRYPRGFPSSPH
jgi:hypothetical protein